MDKGYCSEPAMSDEPEPKRKRTGEEEDEASKYERIEKLSKFADFLKEKGYWEENGFSKERFIEEASKYERNWDDIMYLIKSMYVAEDGGFGKSSIAENL